MDYRVQIGVEVFVCVDRNGVCSRRICFTIISAATSVHTFGEKNTKKENKKNFFKAPRTTKTSGTAIVSLIIHQQINILSFSFAYGPDNEIKQRKCHDDVYSIP